MELVGAGEAHAWGQPARDGYCDRQFTQNRGSNTYLTDPDCGCDDAVGRWEGNRYVTVIRPPRGSNCSSGGGERAPSTPADTNKPGGFGFYRLGDEVFQVAAAGQNEGAPTVGANDDARLDLAVG